MNKKTILSIVLVIIVVMAAVFYLNGQGTTSDGSLTSDVKAIQSSDAQDISLLLQKMDHVELNNSIFTNPVFLSLKDNTATFIPQDSGRDNPFAPIGSNAPSQSSSGTSSRSR